MFFVCIFLSFSHYHGLNELYSFLSGNTGLSVCLYVRLWIAVLQNYSTDVNETFPKWPHIGLVVRVFVLAHSHEQVMTIRPLFGLKNKSTVNAAILIRFFENWHLGALNLMDC